MSEKNGPDNSPLFDQRPWGSFTVLDEGRGYKVKRIEVLSGKRLSYQRHARRAEHWMVVAGAARVTLDDGERGTRGVDESLGRGCAVTFIGETFAQYICVCIA